MSNAFLLTPFTLDRRVVSMDRLAGREWQANSPDLGTGAQMVRMGRIHRALADLVQRAVQDGRRPVSIGGDCCQTLAVMAGLRQAGLDPALVWLDAHGDFNTWETSPSGFIGGMPLAMHVGRGDQTLLQQLALAPMREADVVLSDARDLDVGERVSVEDSAVAHVRQVEEVRARLPHDRPVYVHFDTDVIDSGEAPAMTYPVAGGPSVATMVEVATRLRKSGRLAAVSMTVWALERDQDRTTEQKCLQVLEALTAGEF